MLNGYVYKIDDLQFRALCLLEQNYSIKEVIEKCDIDSEKINNILQDNVKSNLGAFYDKKMYIEKISKDPEWKKYLFFTPPLYFRRAFIELDNKCDSNCFFCNNDEYIRRNMCLGCNKFISEDKVLTEEDLFGVLEKLKKLECEEINFTGGNIFLDWSKTKKIVQKAYELKFKNINIIWGSKTIETSILNSLKKLNITLIVQKYVEPEINFNNDNLIKTLKQSDLDVGFILLLKYENSNYLEEILKSLNSTLNCKFIFFDLLLLKNCKDTKRYMKEINQIPITKMDEFFIKRKFNNCLNGTISITTDGYITPCFGLREYKLGHVYKFSEIFKSKSIDEFWELSKEKIEGCKECQFRYACNDCRSIEIKFGSSLYGMSSCELLTNKE